MTLRDLEVVVFGAGGVTGRRVAAYLDQRSAEGGARWAAAGRNVERLEATLAESGVEQAEVIFADVNDPASLAEMASRAKVVLNLVGPYSLYGEPVIEACVAAGAHYADLTGEIPFVRTMIEDFDAAAREEGVKIVQVCGFEALPPDIAVRLAAEKARERFDEPLAEVDLEVSWKGPPGMPKGSDLISGGTIQSVAVIAGLAGAEAVTDPAALITEDALAERIRELSPIRTRPRRNGSAVLAPMAPIAYINPAVIHRSAELSQLESGTAERPFRYREAMAVKGGATSFPIRMVAAGALAGTQTTFGALTRVPQAIRKPVSGGMQRVLPGSGFGPAADRLEQWSWKIALEASTPSGRSIEVNVDAVGHPGYLATARMLGEAGLMLATAGATPDRAGCLTPATALGTENVERFERAGLRFS